MPCHIAFFALGICLSACSNPGARKDASCAEAAAEAKHWGCDLPSTPNRLLSGTADNAEQCQRIRAHYETACQ